MSQENVQIVRRAFEAFAKDGPDAMVDFWARKSHSGCDLV
jgi:hypothetical protein